MHQGIAREKAGRIENSRRN